MKIESGDYEKLGQFYLGREYDPGTRAVGEELVLYDSKDLVTHGVVLGMTGSGKTGLCMALLEEAAMDNIPAIVIDPKGDIGNILLTFPELRGEDFRPWVNEDDARKKGITPEELAARTAAQWKEGLAEWGQGPERLRQFREKADLTIFTPGSRAGIPVSILSSLEAPPFEVVDDGELFGERIESTVSSLLALVGVDADPVQSPEAVLLASLFGHCWSAGESLTLESLIRHIQRPPFGKVGVIDVESFMGAKDRQALALRLNNLLASPGFATWLEGPPLDIQRLMYTAEGKPRISVFSIAHLSDPERMFFVSLLLNQLLGWMRRQGGTTSLRALFYMDEIYGFLPPTANPPSKKPLLTMLKQARAFGLGTLLATQNPVDLDYKALSNIGTWFLGRLQTERDKMRVLDGLEGAATEGGNRFNKQEMERLLSGLDGRVFLMNNVHEDSPVAFHVRWVMSFLCGPLTRTQIKALMDPKRGEFEGGPAAAAVAAAPGNPMSIGGGSPAPATAGTRPVVGEGVEERFVPPAGETRGLRYRPALLRQATVHFSAPKAKLDGARGVRFVNPIGAGGIDWADELGGAALVQPLEREPRAGAGFDELPGYAMNAANYKQVRDEFEEWIYRNERVDLFHAPQLDEYSRLGEAEGDFRARLGVRARERRDEVVERLREKYARMLKAKEDQLDRAEAGIDREKAEATSATVSVLGGLLGGLLGGRKGRGGLVSGGSRVYKQGTDVARAKRQAKELEDEIARLETELRGEVEDLEREFDPSQIGLETLTVKPYKKDIEVELVGLLWLPVDERGERAW